MKEKDNNVKKRTAQYGFALSVLFLLLLISFFCSLFFGAEKIDIRAVFGNADDEFAKILFTQIRIPRTLLAALTGVLLAGSGAAFQLYFRNPLAEPGIMGISSGATLGAVIAGCFGIDFSFTQGKVMQIFTGTISPVNSGAFIGALLAGLLVTLLAGKRTGPAATVALLLCGTALGTFYSAFSSIILLIRSKELHTMYMWMLGSFSGRGWDELLFILIPSFLAIVLLLFSGRQLDLLAGGETTALSLGVEVGKLRLLVIIAGSLASSAAVCAGGTIGFVGLIAPHTIRRIFGAKGRSLIPLSMVGGAILMLLADTVARVVNAPAEIPVGTITSLLGAPFFISLVFSKRGLKNG